MSPPATVFATFEVLKNHVNFKVNHEIPQIDNIIFKFHYRATFLILLSCSILVSSRQFFGEHIKCISDAGVPSHVIDSFCFFNSTFTVTKYMNASILDDGEIPHPGVGPNGKRDEITHHAYYQWVPFVLFLQALLFYLPHHIWRNVEGGRLKMLVSGLHFSAIALTEEKLETENGVKVLTKNEKDEKIQQMRYAFVNRLHLNRPWAYYLGICELMNFVNVIVQMYVTNRFLGGAFVSLGRNVTEIDPDASMDALDIIFPKVTKCTFHKYGASGDVQKHDALCVMALNIINEKIYAFLWFWFLILAVLTFMGLVWRLLTMLLYSRSVTFNKWVFTLACPGRYQPWKALTLTNEYFFGDWLFLYYIARNVENYIFKELLEGIAQDLEDRKMAMYRTISTIEDEAEPLKKTDYSSPKDAEAQRNEGSLMSL